MTEGWPAAVSTPEYIALLRGDFHTFALRCFKELNSGAPFQPTRHFVVMAAKLQELRDGRAKRLIVNIPPRHLKSLAASIALPAWLLGHDPNAAIVNVTYGQELSDKFARDCRAVMMTSWYRSVFATRLSPNRPALQELVTTAGGFRLATSVGGVLTGRGADFIIIDDPLKPSEAMSESRRAAANEWFDGTLYSRLNDKTKGAIVIIMQRLHEDDLVGHVLQREGWDVLSFAAIAETDEKLIVETPFGPQTIQPRNRRAAAPRAGIAGDARANPRDDRRIQFRRPVSADPRAGRRRHGQGGVVSALSRRGSPLELRSDRAELGHRQQTERLADYSVCTTWGLKGPNFWLLNVLRKKLAYPELKRAVREQRELFKPTAILVEDKASGTQLIQELIADGLSAVTRYAPDGDKIMRLHTQTATIENGFVHLPETPPGCLIISLNSSCFRTLATTTRSIRPHRRWPGPSSPRPVTQSSSSIAGWRNRPAGSVSVSAFRGERRSISS